MKYRLLGALIFSAVQAFAAKTITLPSDPPLQFTTARAYGAVSTIEAAEGKDSVGYSLREDADISTVVISVGRDSVVRTVSSIKAMADGAKVDKKKAKVCGEDCEFLNWKMNGYFYGATSVEIEGRDKKQLIAIDIMALTSDDLRQVEAELTSLRLANSPPKR